MRKAAPEERRNIFVKQKAKTVAAETVSEYVHFGSVANVFNLLQRAGRTEFLAPDQLLERDGAQH
jgi:hypothetical protein